MKKSEIIITIIALVIATLVAFGVYYLLVVRQHLKTGTSNEPCIAKTPYKEIAVAKKTIYIGEFIGPDVLGYAKWPETALNSDFFLHSNVTPDTFKEFVAKRSISSGEPLTKNNIIDSKKQGALAALLKPGMRAVSISVDPASISSGLVVPGDIVDVIVTFTSSEGTGNTGNEILSKTVLCSVKVLALDHKTNDQPPEEDQKTHNQNPPPVIPRTATLEVTPAQAETLLIAAKMGVVFLSLHSASSREKDNCIPATLERKKPKPKEKEKVKIIERKIVEQGVKIIRGGSSGTTEVKS